MKRCQKQSLTELQSLLSKNWKPFLPIHQDPDLPTNITLEMEEWDTVKNFRGISFSDVEHLD